MANTPRVSRYHNSITKKLFDLVFSIIGFIILFPLAFLIVFIFKPINKGPILFKQKRVGKNGNIFTLYKLRTMRQGAESERGNKELEKLNIADGPVFKISNDPRLTPLGKVLWKSGLDEVPQIINVIRGEMSFVGPRPFPVYEAEKLKKYEKTRELILPGIISSWVISGSHNLKFEQWMDLDRRYVEKATLLTDLSIVYKTTMLLLSIGFGKIKKLLGS